MALDATAMRSTPDTSAFVPSPQRVVLVLQGGGALGAYQAGVYQALHEAGLRPDWVIGTSIGAINASLIVGNPPERRLDRMQAFWQRLGHNAVLRGLGSLPFVGPQLAMLATMASGLDAFFRPNPIAQLAPQWPLGADRAGYYSTDPLRETLSSLVDFDLINTGVCRLTVGAANVRTAEMRYFDSRDMRFDVRHVMASGALPPAFPPVRIDGELFWDGGILSNTPVEAIFDDNPRRSAVVFVVHVWNPAGPEPDTMLDVMNRMKDVQYSSRARNHIARQKQLHRLRHVIAELVARLPEDQRGNNEVRELAGYGCLTQMHVVRLLAPSLSGETHLKDIDFSPTGIEARWRAGHEQTAQVLARAPWTEQVNPLEGLILHEAVEGRMVGPAA
jgi:NTE family protein